VATDLLGWLIRRIARVSVKTGSLNDQECEKGKSKFMLRIENLNLNPT